MKKYNNLVIAPDSSIKEALRVIDNGALQIGIVTDAQSKLIGTITDGDIRRGLLKGLTLEDSIESVIYRTPVTAHINEPREAILEKAFDKKIHQVPLIDDKGKFVGIEVVDELVRPKSYPNKVVLMVGGLGTRLAPLTDNIPKPLLKIGDKPILETIINNFSRHGFTNILLSVNYKAEMIEEYFKDGSNFGVNIEYVHEEQRMGTAGALSLMSRQITEPFFVMNGDLLTSINFNHMLDFHLAHDSMATMAVRQYDFQVPYGVVQVDGEKIKSIEEKPVQKFYVSAGLYILSPDTLPFIPEKQFYDMPTLFDKLISENKNVISFPVREYWLDIGKHSDFEQAKADYRQVFE
jgi:dTDP-glucose pyrophosphorylase